MNRIVKLLIISDIFVMTGFGLISPILAIFIKENLVGGSIFAAGLAGAIFFITKIIIQLPFSRYIDDHKEKVKWLIVGTLFISAVPFIYIFAKHVYVIFIAQVVYGIGAGLAYPTWLGLFSTHLDKKHESFEWSLYSTFTGLGTAGTAFIGAAIAQWFGFELTFVFVGIMALIGCMILLLLQHKHLQFRKPNLKQVINYYPTKKLIHRKYS